MSTQLSHKYAHQVGRRQILTYLCHGALKMDLAAARPVRSDAFLKNRFLRADDLFDLEVEVVVACYAVRDAESRFQDRVVLRLDDFVELDGEGVRGALPFVEEGQAVAE